MSRYDKIMQVAWDAHNNGDCECVTITLSRATAERWITEAYDTTDRKAVLVELACRAALKAEK